jgi:protein-S-isoprenylcysteine O-methyltransferase Ste14
MQVEKLSLILLKTAIFTAVAPFTVGLWFPTQVHRAYDSRAFSSQPSFPCEIVSWILFSVGAAIYFWCAWDFGAKGLGAPAPIDAPKNLVVNGLYRHLRNPMYVGVFFLVLSRAVYFWSVPIVVYLLLVTICVNLFVLFYEEPHLRKVFGEQYLDYCRRVPRWIPRIRTGR